MKRILLVVVIVLVVISLPLINLIRWTFQLKRPVDIILVDKTVPTLERENHKIFDWILTNERFVKKGNGSSYSYKRDYYGFVPKRPLRDKKFDKNDYRLTDIISLAEKNDAVYFADTYGVSFNDWFKGINRSRRTRKLYGGLNNNDFLLLKEMMARNKLVIMEYNSFDYPTIDFESARTQAKLGLTFAGWTGKYFSSLDTTTTDFPIWMTAMYRSQYRKQWRFTKPGIVLLSEKEIVVLEIGTDLKDAMPHIITDQANSEKFGVTQSVAFDKWFDIIDPLQNNVISKFRIETTPAGDSLLANKNLSREFPAVIQEPVSKRTYYFSGDFACGDLPFWTSRFKGIDKLKGILYSERPEDTRRFFWLYYKPLISKILIDYSDSVKSK